MFQLGSNEESVLNIRSVLDLSFKTLSLLHGSQSGGDLAPQRISSTVCGHFLIVTTRALLESSAERPEMLVNILQGTG